MDAQNIFVNYLQKNDLKNTPERMIILKEVLKLEDHFEAENLLDHIKSFNLKVSRASIYRTLDHLVQCGLVKKINFDSTCSYYENVVNKSGHDHFICSVCGKIIEFYNNKIEKIHDSLIKNHNVEINDYSHQIYGKCKNCINKHSSQ